MPIDKERYLTWHGDRWRSATGKLIDKRLQRSRRQIAAAANLSDETEIDAMMEELSSALRRCWALQRDVVRAPSSAGVRRVLEALEQDPDWGLAHLDHLDPETLGTLEEHFPGGWLGLQQFEGNMDVLLRAIRDAKASLPPKRRGRPVGTKEHAVRELGRHLAEIYGCFRRRPTRRVVPKSSKSRRHLRSTEYGPFKDFVTTVLAPFPKRLTRKGGVKGIDFIVRLGVEHISRKPQPE
jgi:hypothetical protein